MMRSEFSNAVFRIPCSVFHIPPISWPEAALRPASSFTFAVSFSNHPVMPPARHRESKPSVVDCAADTSSAAIHSWWATRLGPMDGNLPVIDRVLLSRRVRLVSWWATMYSISFQHYHTYSLTCPRESPRVVIVADPAAGRPLRMDSLERRMIRHPAKGHHQVVRGKPARPRLSRPWTSAPVLRTAHTECVSTNLHPWSKGFPGWWQWIKIAGLAPTRWGGAHGAIGGWWILRWTISSRLGRLTVSLLERRFCRCKECQSVILSWSFSLLPGRHWYTIQTVQSWQGPKMITPKLWPYAFHRQAFIVLGGWVTMMMSISAKELRQGRPSWYGRKTPPFFHERSSIHRAADHGILITNWFTRFCPFTSRNVCWPAGLLPFVYWVHRQPCLSRSGAAFNPAPSTRPDQSQLDLSPFWPLHQLSWAGRRKGPSVKAKRLQQSHQCQSLEIFLEIFGDSLRSHYCC